MAIFQIDSSEPLNIDYAASGLAATLQNVSFLLNSLVDSYPMHREFGMEPPVDDPSEYAKNEWSAQVIEKLERNIQGIDVQAVEISQDESDLLNGRIRTLVKVVIEVDEV